MSSFVDIIVRFGEKGLASVTRNANSLMGGLNKTLNSTQKQSQFATKSIAELNATLDGLKKKRDIQIDTRQITAANKEIAALENKIRTLNGANSGGGSSSSGIGGFLKTGLMAAGIAGLAMGAKRVALDSLSASMAYGTNTKSFEVLTGNAARGRAMATSLRDMKMNTLVGGGVYKNAQTLLGFGVNENSILKKVHEVGDVGMGDTERMQALTLARAQTTAAGKLMGQDLLQYVNAGFNPLSVMADRWKEFGFKTKQTVGTLKDLMSEGAITSEMVDKAFTLATSKGGRFYHMMDEIGETAGGKLLKLKGAWAATQIDIGNSLTPLAEAGMKAATSLLHLVNIGESVPDSLRGERLEANSLVAAITHLNEKNETRGLLIDSLRKKYPDFFGEIDKEKTKNEELLSILDKVNAAYDRRIDRADHVVAAQVAKDEKGDLLRIAVAARKQAEYEKNHTGLLDKTKYLGTYDRLFTIPGLGLASGDMGWDRRKKQPNLISLAQEAEKRAGDLAQKAAKNEGYVNSLDNQDLLNEAKRYIGNDKGLRGLWGKNYKKNMPTWQKEIANWRKMYDENGGKFTGSFLTYDYSKLQGLLHPDGQGGDLVGAVADGGSKITGGGARQIIMNLNAPLIKEQVFHVASMKEGVSVSLQEQMELLLRMLNGAASAVS